MNARQLTDIQPWILLGSLFLFLGLETLRPLVTPLRRDWHILHNVGLLAIQVAVNLGVSVLFVAVTDYGEQHQLGLFRQVDLAWGWQMLFSVAILDFVQYWGHRLLAHRIPFFWRFHQVHHSDSQLDASSALRFHPGEAIGLSTHWVGDYLTIRTDFAGTNGLFPGDYHVPTGSARQRADSGSGR